MNIPFEGGCACGAVRYTVSAAPIMSGHCQCRDCQRASGTGHSSHVMVPLDAVAVRGEVRFWESRADSGNLIGRGFCPHCGTPLFSRNAAMPQAFFLRPASLDNPAQFTPQMVVYTARGHAWDTLDPALPRFDLMPQMQA
jgi:hypothetical protein